jgi:quercetin dioxygenase-like cupin family protein
MIFPSSEAIHHRPLPGVERKEVACGKDCQMIEFRLEKGAAIPLHQHSNEQIGTVLSGHIILTLGNKRTDLGAGDGYSIGRGEPHSVEVIEDSLVLDVFSPPRDDYRDWA